MRRFTTRKMMASLAFAAAALALPVTAGAQGQQPLPPPNDMACNGLIVAYGDHPDASPAFFAKTFGIPVAQAIILARDFYDCALQK